MVGPSGERITAASEKQATSKVLEIPIGVASFNKPLQG